MHGYAPRMPADWTIVHAGALGDLALTVQLALRLPRIVLEGSLTLVSRADLGNLADRQPRIRHVAAEGLALHWLHIEESSAGESQDVSPCLAELIRGRRVISALGGPDTQPYRRLSELAPAALFGFDPRPRGDWPLHIVDQWQRDLEAQGLLFDRCTYRGRGGRSLHAVPHAASPAMAPLDAGAAAEVVLHPGSGGREKCWPRACFIKLAACLVARGERVRFVAGPVEREWWGDDELAMLRNAAPLSVCQSADELIELLRTAHAFVGNDSGPTHLAALLGIATVAIFGPTRSERWRPLGSRATVVAAVSEQVERHADWGLSLQEIVAALDQVAPRRHDGRSNSLQ